MAQSLRVDLRAVPGSGPGRRILIDDLAQYIRGREIATKKRKGRSTQPDLGKPGERIPLQGLRRSIAEHMVTAKQTIPHYSYIDECDVTKMVALRNRLKRPYYAAGIKLTNLPFYVKAVVESLKQVPIINASLDEESGQIVLHDRYDIGIATATPKGLIVPVIRHADQKELAEIARDIERLIRGAQQGSLDRAELQGSTFTVSSVGNFGGLVSTPIIHHPEVGIVAIGKIFRRPTYNEQQEIVPARIAYLSFSFDHRVVDGSVGAIFGNAVIQQLQKPEGLAPEAPPAKR
jgi:pyruvate dehydrogenase E2 component (dihydrolipoamide acetyltransferase)/2-oxoisovalerate dehydrogenase E2 component (dihydrolipoyl transacylase)